MGAESPMPNLAECLLARITDPIRAAAIMGDLEELSATRGRLWFRFAYVRTLITLGWRTPVALVAAIVSVKYLRRAIAGFLQPLTFHNFASSHSHLSFFAWTVSLWAMFLLWIVLPYVAFRFGLRNRLTYLAGTLFLLGLPVYTLRPQVFQFTGLACALVIVAALASPLWHRQMLFLIANAVVSRLIFYVCINDPLRIFHPHQHLHPMSLFRMRIDDPVAIVITIMIGPPLYRWLLQPRPKGVANAEPA